MGGCVRLLLMQKTGLDEAALASELKRESTIGEAAVEQGKLHMFLGDLAEADRWLQIGRAIWQKEEIAHQLAMAHAYLAKLNCLQNELVQAQVYLEDTLAYLADCLEGLDDPVEMMQCL